MNTADATACFVVVALTLLCGFSGCLMRLLFIACRFWSAPTSQSMVLQQASSARMLTRSTPSAGVASVSLIVCPCSCLVCIFGKNLNMINTLSRCITSMPDCVLMLLYYVQFYSAVHFHGFLLSFCSSSAFVRLFARLCNLARSVISACLPEKALSGLIA